MATVTGFTADHLVDLTDEMIVAGEVVGDDLILTQLDGTPVNAGNVRGPSGPTGAASSVPGPTGATGATGPTGPQGASGNEIPVFSVGGVLASQTFTMRLYANRAMTISSVRASVGSYPVGSSIVIDVMKNGVTIFTGGVDRPTIASGTYTDVGTPDVTALAAGDYLTVTIVSVGSTTAGSDLTVQVVAS